MRIFLENLEQFAIDVILERRGGKRAALLRFFLLLVSKLYRVIVSFRLTLYRNRIFRERSLGCMVISIGNLTVGGTGKTPVVEKIARTLSDAGRTVTILSRGYKSVKPSILRRLKHMLSGKTFYFPPRVVSDGKEVKLNSRIAGDEPFMLATNLKGVSVVVDKDRVKSGLYAIKNFNTDTLLLDDGLQYLKLRHRLDIVLIDRYHPFGNEYLLPRGTMREPPKNLKRASYIFITKCDGSSNAQLRSRIRLYNQTAEIIECAHKPMHLINVNNGEKLPLDFLRDKYVGSISGIAVPESFDNGLKKLGAQIVVKLHFADHHRYSKREIISFVKRCAECDVDAVITTEKDFVRLPKIKNPDVPIYYLRVEIDIISGHETWNQCIKRICKPHPMASARRFF